MVDFERKLDMLYMFIDINNNNNNNDILCSVGTCVHLLQLRHHAHVEIRVLSGVVSVLLAVCALLFED